MVAVRPFFFFGFLLGVTTACDGRPDDTTFTNVGALCFTSTSTDTVEVDVSFPGCLSSSCDTPKNGQCRITEKDGVIRVTSFGQVEHDGGDCTDDCGSFTTRCVSDPIAPGTYVVTYGDQTSDLTLPTSGEQRFGGSAFPACQ